MIVLDSVIVQYSDIYTSRTAYKKGVIEYEPTNCKEIKQIYDDHVLDIKNADCTCCPFPYCVHEDQLSGNNGGGRPHPVVVNYDHIKTCEACKALESPTIYFKNSRFKMVHENGKPILTLLDHRKATYQESIYMKDILYNLFGYFFCGNNNEGHTYWKVDVNVDEAMALLKKMSILDKYHKIR